MALIGQWVFVPLAVLLLILAFWEPARRRVLGCKGIQRLEKRLTLSERGYWAAFALILPLCVSSFNVVICKTFFKTNIPESIIESAQIDGATQFQIFGKIALPLSKPLMATIALFLTFGYWNDWFQSSLYISDTKLYSLQALLDHVQRNIEMMANNPSLGVTTAQYMNSMPKEGARMAMAIIIIIPIACCYPFFQKYFISGLTVGAVKG